MLRASIAQVAAYLLAPVDGGPIRGPGAAAILSGPAMVSGSRVIQKIAGGVAGCDYALRCEIDVADGSHYVLAGVLPVRKA